MERARSLTFLVHRRTEILVTVDDPEAFLAAAAAEGLAEGQELKALALRIERGEYPRFPGLRWKVEENHLRITEKK